MATRDLRKRKTFIQFIEVTQSIMQEEGMQKVSIRRVADMADYNSATIYNYFKDLDHLILFASLKYLNEYNQDVVERLKNCQNMQEGFMIMWDSFCKISFKHPEAFNKIFFNKHSKELEQLAEQYYELFPEEKTSSLDIMVPIFSNLRLEERNAIVLRKLYENSPVTEKDIEIMNELMVNAYYRLLIKCIANKEIRSEKHYTDKMFEYINFLLNINEK